LDAETLKCICGHLFRHHFILDLDTVTARKDNTVCVICERENWIHDFKLDNLDYVEKLAEERKLI
jgi:hypothetical protein